MKKLFIAVVFAFVAFTDVNAQEYKIVTAVESIIPGGLGRSRIIENQSEANASQLTTGRTDGKRSGQGDIKRKSAKVNEFTETKLLNFFSITGINFQNIASNDAIIGDRINTLIAEGWELAFVTSGVESHSAGPDGSGLFITRYIFKRSN